MATLWFTETPDNQEPLKEMDRSDCEWTVCVGEDNGRIGLSIQSSKMPSAKMIDITPQLDSLIAALQAASRRLGRKAPVE